MADHGGLSMALEAYTTWRRTNRDVRLPALPFDDMQLFFLGYALPWCARHTDKHSAHQILNDEHAPERSDNKSCEVMRITIVMSDSECSGPCLTILNLLPPSAAP